MSTMPQAQPTPAQPTPSAAPKKAPGAKPFHHRVWGMLPTPIRMPIRAWVMKRRLARNYHYDMNRFAQASGVLDKTSRGNLRALITMDYHRLEKGMALEAPRSNFGQDVLARLKRDLPIYLNQFGRDEITEVALNALDEYIEMHASRGIELPELKKSVDEIRVISDKVSEGAAPTCGVGEGGTIEKTRESLTQASPNDPDAFFASRHSVRHYEPGAIDDELIHRAVKMAMRSPSVCNRQGWRVHRFNTPELRDKALSYQNGNRGFGHTAAEALVVTCDMRCFVIAGERNQCWIDGGMFSMALVLALHSVGLGACCLNWSVEKERDQSMRNALGIPEHEAVMMMISVGKLPEKLRVAESPRRPLDVILTEHQA